MSTQVATTAGTTTSPGRSVGSVLVPSSRGGAVVSVPVSPSAPVVDGGTPEVSVADASAVVVSSVSAGSPAVCVASPELLDDVTEA